MTPRKRGRTVDDADADTARGGAEAVEGEVLPGSRHPVAGSRMPRRFREMEESDEDA